MSEIRKSKKQRLLKKDNNYWKSQNSKVNEMYLV